jgi:hypothetical protein
MTRAGLSAHMWRQMASLPPDLDRLGDQLMAAAARTRDKRSRRGEQRRRLTVAGVVGAIAFAVLTPGELGPAIRDLTLANATVVPPGCELPRGSGFMLPRCKAARAARPHRPYAPR